MADLQTPSAAAVPATTTKDASTTRPEKPDEKLYKSELAKAEEELNVCNEQMKNFKLRLQIAIPNDQDSPVNKRLIAELTSIRQKQQSGIAFRLDKIKRLEEQLKSLIIENKNARSRVIFKSADDVQREIDRLQKQVDTGAMKIVDEKMALAEISTLYKQKKGFAGFDAGQKRIDDVKTQIAHLRETIDDPEQKALSDRYNLLNSLRDERDKIHQKHQVKYQALKKIKVAFYQKNRAAAEFEKKAYLERRAVKDALAQDKRKQVAWQKLDEASTPAYGDEILATQGLIRYFDPSTAEAKTATGPGKFAAQATRTVDDSGFKGTRLPKKGEEDEDYFVGGGGKKSKKGRKGRDSPAPANEKYNLSIGVIEELSKVGVDAPASQGDVPAVVEKLKERLAHWKGDQDRKTKENIAKAQKEIERLETEAINDRATQTVRKDTTEKQHINGHASAGAELDQEQDATEKQPINGHASAGAELDQEKDDAVDVAEDDQKAKLEDAALAEGSDQ